MPMIYTNYYIESATFFHQNRFLFYSNKNHFLASHITTNSFSPNLIEARLLIILRRLVLPFLVLSRTLTSHHIHSNRRHPLVVASLDEIIHLIRYFYYRSYT